MAGKRFDLFFTTQLESRDGALTKGALIRNGFSEQDGAGERWSNMRPALQSAVPGTLSGPANGLIVMSGGTGGTVLWGVVGGSIGTWAPPGTFAVSTAHAVPGFVAVLGSTLYKIAIETQVVYQSTLAPTLVFTTSGTTTAYSDNNKADFTQTTQYIVAGMGASGFYDYWASTDGLTWEPVDVGAYSVRPGNIVGFGARVFRFNPVSSVDTYMSYFKGTSTTGWDQTGFGTQASSFGSFTLNTSCLGTAADKIWAIGTATWTGGTSVIVVAGSSGGSGPFTWSLIGTLPNNPYGITFQKRFAWNAASGKAVIPSGTGNPGSITFVAITTAGVVTTLGTTVVLTNPNLGASPGGTLAFLNSLVQIARFDIGGGGGFTP